MILPEAPNRRWSSDFVSDALSNGRRFRVLVVVDDFTRERLALVVDMSLSNLRVGRKLFRITELRGCPVVIVCDNYTELTPQALLCWEEERGMLWHTNISGKPQQNGLVQSFNGRFRADRCMRRSERASVRKLHFSASDHQGMEDRPQLHLGRVPADGVGGSQRGRAQ